MRMTKGFGLRFEQGNRIGGSDRPNCLYLTVQPDLFLLGAHQIVLERFQDRARHLVERRGNDAGVVVSLGPAQHAVRPDAVPDERLGQAQQTKTGSYDFQMHLPIFKRDPVKFMKISDLVEDRLAIDPGGIAKAIVNGAEKDGTGGEKLIGAAAIHAEARSPRSVVEVAYPTSDDVGLR